MSRRKIAAGNWKMNTNSETANELSTKISQANIPSDVEVILGVPFVFLSDCISNVASSTVSIAAQNCHAEEKGAYTGEISAEMLTSINCPYVILGHSERRQYNHEDEAILAAKVNRAFAQNLSVIFCCGEPLEVRKAGTQNDYVCSQIEKSLFHLEASDFSKLIIAYEPIWAIGTGETASPEQAQDMHEAIRNFISNKYGSDVAEIIPILYGGSVKSKNAKEIFSKKDVDGGLVGGASLDAEHFEQIINSFGA